MSTAVVREQTEHHVGELAYLDSLMGGLVPCKVIGIEQDWLGKVSVKVKTTAKRWGFDKGEVITWPATTVVPRCKVRKAPFGSYRIINSYTWVVS